MPGTHLNEQQLREWYARFSQEVLEKASIDVNRIEDVGRIKNYAFEEWGSLDDPGDYERAQVGEPTYAFMLHKGTKSVPRRPEYVPIDEHMKWVKQNLRTGADLGIEDLRNLYNMSRAGTLMINAPGKGAKFIQQVYTDKDGNITTSKPVEEYSTHELQRTRGSSWVGLPKFVPIPDPAQYMRPEEPKPPREPKNMKPGWLSKIAWKIGFKNTDYGKLMDYKAAYRRYETQLEDWSKINPVELTENYRAALERREQFVSQMEQLRTSNMVILHGINGGYTTYAMTRSFADSDNDVDESLEYIVVMSQEDKMMKAWHEETPLGQMGTALQKIQTNLDNIAKRTLKAAKSLMAFNQSELTPWIEKGVYKRGEINNSSKTDPKMPQPPFVRARGENISIDELRDRRNALTVEKVRERDAWQADMDMLAGLAGVCALGETAKENFGDLVASFFTEGHANSSDKLSYIGPARLKGLEAVADWGDGNSTKIGQLFSTGLRMLNEEVKKLGSLQDQHALGCMFLIDKLMKTAEEKTNIMDALDLNLQERAEIERNREVFKAVCQGKESRAALMEYATHKKNMTQDELKQAALDILYEDYLTKMSLDGTVPEFVTKPAVVAAVQEELIAKNNLNQFAAMDRFEVGTLAQSPLDFVKGLSAQNGQAANAKQVQNEQPMIENEMKPKESVKL